MIRTPDINAAEVRALCNSLRQNGQPFYVPFRPLPEAPLRECFSVVAGHVLANGGQVVLGWNIVELKGIWLEAEFHAIWRSPDGELLDLTPREFPQSQYLFLPDGEQPYEGTQVESKFHPLTNHPSVIKHIQLAPEFYYETNRADQSDATSYTFTPKIAALKAEMEYLLTQFPWQR
jgi:hypothetical protein